MRWDLSSNGQSVAAKKNTKISAPIQHFQTTPRPYFLILVDSARCEMHCEKKIESIAQKTKK